MTPDGVLPHDAPKAIPPGSTAKRLAALARRLGGNTAPIKARLGVPPLPAWHDCDGQQELFEEGESHEAAE